MDIFPTFGPGDSEAQRCETKEKLNLNTRKKNRTCTKWSCPGAAKI